MALLVFLEKLGVNAKEVTIIQVAEARRNCALTKGVISGLVFNEPQAAIAVKKFGMQSDRPHGKQDPFPPELFHRQTKLPRFQPG